MNSLDFISILGLIALTASCFCLLRRETKKESKVHIDHWVADGTICGVIMGMGYLFYTRGSGMLFNIIVAYIFAPFIPIDLVARLFDKGFLGTGGIFLNGYYQFIFYPLAYALGGAVIGRISAAIFEYLRDVEPKDKE